VNKKNTAETSPMRIQPSVHARFTQEMAHRFWLAVIIGVIALLGAAADISQAASPIISTYANSFIPVGAGAITLSQPSAVATDTAGNVYIADTGNCVVWEFPSNGQKPFALAGQAGNCAGSYASTNPTLDSLNHPVDVAVCNGTVYIADTSSSSSTGLHAVTGGIFSNVVLHYTSTPGIQGVVQPQAIACDNAGDLYVQSVYDSTDANGPAYTIDTLPAGGLTLNVGGNGLDKFQGVALDANGNVYSVRSNAPASGTQGIGTIAKFTPTSTSTTNGPSFVWNETLLSQSRPLIGSTRIALDPQGNFYVNEAAAPPANSPIGPTVYVTEVSAAGAVAYLAGNGLAGFAGDGGPPLSAALNNVNGIAVGANIFIADTGNNRVRQLSSATVSLLATDKIPNFGLHTAVNPLTQELYVAAEKGNYTVGGPVNDIVVYSAAGTVVANIPAASTAAIVADLIVDPVNNVIYATNQDGTVTVIDGATYAINATLPVGVGPLGIAVDPALNLAYVANTGSTFISVIHGPVRNSSKAIITPAFSVSSDNITSILPLGAIDVDKNSHTVYAVVTGPSNLGSTTYALAMIQGGVVTNTVSYLLDAGFVGIEANALAVDQRSGLVVIADSASQGVTVYNPQSATLQSFGEVFFPTNIAMDSANEIAYASAGVGNVSQINLVGGGQSTVNTPASGQNCGSGGTAVGVDPAAGQAYFTTCDATHGAVVTVWNGASRQASGTLSLGSLTSNFGAVTGDFAVVVNPSSHVAYVSNSGSSAGEIDVINGPAAPVTPQLTLSVNGAPAQPLNTAASVAFGSVAVGQRGAAQSFTVTDTGSAAAAVLPPMILGGNFTNTGSTCAAGILLSAGGGSCATSIAFAPSTNLPLTSGLVFLDSERDTPQIVGLTGTGTGTHTLTISPSSIPAAYVGLPYAPSGFPVSFSSPNASGGFNVNLCTVQTGSPTAPPNTSNCCPSGSSSIGPPMSCPAGLLPPGMNWFEPDLSAPTGNITTTGTFTFSVVATDPAGDTGFANYTLVVNPMFTLLFGLSAPSVTGGSSVTATVTLNAPAPTGGAIVFLNSSNTSVVHTTVVTVSAGTTTGTATLTTSAVTAPQPVTIGANYDGNNITQTLTVTPPGGPPSPASITVLEIISVSDLPTFPDLVAAEPIMVTDGVTISATVPNVVGDLNGTAVGDAGAILASAGLTVGTVTFVTSTTVPAGTVISQSPGPTSTESPGEAINLVVSSGLPQVLVPNVVNDTLAQVAVAFGPGGLSDSVTFASSSTVPAGRVISQAPIGGTPVTFGSNVVLVLSSGAAPVTINVPETITTSDGVTNLPVRVPSVVGEPLATAQTNIQNANLAVGTITSQASSAVASGSVISQSPSAPGSANSGSAVNLVISSGPAHVSIGVSGAPTIIRGTAGLRVTLFVKNSGNVTAQTVGETSVTLNGIAATAIATPLTNLAPGATGSFVLTYPGSAGASGAIVGLIAAGSYSAPPLAGGTWTSGGRVRLP
jgi:YVTN family beta-propeller protein